MKCQESKWGFIWLEKGSDSVENSLNKRINLKGVFKSQEVKNITSSLISITLAFLISSLIILFMGESPIKAFNSLFKGAFGNQRAIFNTIAMSIPLMFTGLSVAVATKAGMFNIGAEGQFYMGSMASVIFALTFPDLPKLVLLPLMMMVGFAGGALWGLIPGYLRAKLGINEVIVCIMLNYIATLFTSYLVGGPYKAVGMVAQSNEIPMAARLVRYTKTSQLTNAIFIALGVIVIVYIILWKTSIGYKIRSVGSNFTAAEAAGINTKKMMVLAAALSGGIAALAGVTEISGKYYRFVENFSTGYGFTGIAVSVLAKDNPFGIILTALLFGMLDAGALTMTMETSVSPSLIKVIQSLIILFVAAPRIVEILRKKGSM